MLSREKAQLLYNQLIEHRRKEKLRKSKDTPGLVEIHHIVPLSLGGADTSENKVALFAKEHFMAHVYLWVIHRRTCNSDKMACALMCMLKGRNSDKELVNLAKASVEYQEARRAFSTLKSASMRQFASGCNNVSFGKHWYRDPNSAQCARFTDGMQPEGWVRGRHIKLCGQNKGKVWVCSRELNLNKLILSSEAEAFVQANTGWRLGCIRKKDIRKTKESIGNRLTRAGMQISNARKYVDLHTLEVKLVPEGELVPDNLMPFKNAMKNLTSEQKAKAIAFNNRLADTLRAKWLAEVQAMADFYSDNGYEATLKKFKLTISCESLLMKFIRCRKLYGLRFISKHKHY